MESRETVRENENNAIIDHLEAVRRIVAGKCARCGGQCMGCVFDGLDSGMFRAHLDAALALMAHLPNSRNEVVAEATQRQRQRQKAWQKFSDKEQ